MVHIVPIDPLERDRHLAALVSAHLAARHRPTLRRLAVEVHDGEVTVRGRVGSFYEKQLTGDCCRHVPGVRRLIDEVCVESRA